MISNSSIWLQPHVLSEGTLLTVSLCSHLEEARLIGKGAPFAEVKSILIGAPLPLLRCLQREGESRPLSILSRLNSEIIEPAVTSATRQRLMTSYRALLEDRSLDENAVAVRYFFAVVDVMMTGAQEVYDLKLPWQKKSSLIGNLSRARQSKEEGDAFDSLLEVPRILLKSGLSLDAVQACRILIRQTGEAGDPSDQVSRLGKIAAARSKFFRSSVFAGVSEDLRTELLRCHESFLADGVGRIRDLDFQVVEILAKAGFRRDAANIYRHWMAKSGPEMIADRIKFACLKEETIPLFEEVLTEAERLSEKGIPFPFRIFGLAERLWRQRDLEYFKRVERRILAVLQRQGLQGYETAARILLEIIPDLIQEDDARAQILAIFRLFARTNLEKFLWFAHYVSLGLLMLNEKEEGMRILRLIVDDQLGYRYRYCERFAKDLQTNGLGGQSKPAFDLLVKVASALPGPFAPSRPIQEIFDQSHALREIGVCLGQSGFKEDALRAIERAKYILDFYSHVFKGRDLTTYHQALSGIETASLRARL